MRLTPLTLAIGMAALTLSSAGAGQGRSIDPRSTEWVERGGQALTAGDPAAAAQAFETAAAIDPANPAAFNGLGEAALAQELPGKAIRFYREALLIDDADTTALGGIGVAFAAKGATSQAEASLARLNAVCGTDCPEWAELQAALERGTVSAAAVQSTPVVQPAPIQPN